MDDDLSRAVAALPGSVWTALLDQHIGFLNERACEYTGLDVAEADCRGQNAIDPEDLPKLLERF